MKTAMPIVIFLLSIVAALMFEWAYRLLSKNYRMPETKFNWTLWYWLAVWMLLMTTGIFNTSNPFSFIIWLPMGFVAFIHAFLNAGNAPEDQGNIGSDGFDEPNTKKPFNNKQRKDEV